MIILLLAVRLKLLQRMEELDPTGIMKHWVMGKGTGFRLPLLIVFHLSCSRLLKRFPAIRILQDREFYPNVGLIIFTDR